MEEYFYLVCRFLLICAAASVSIYLIIAKFQFSPVIRRLIAAAAISVIMFSKYIAYCIYSLLAGFLAVLIVPAIIAGFFIIIIKWFKSF